MPPIRCAYCHDNATVEAQPCWRCGVVLHYDCWQALEDCPTIGCGGAVVVSPKTVPVTRRSTVLLAAAASFFLIGGVALVQTSWSGPFEPLTPEVVEVPPPPKRPPPLRNLRSLIPHVSVGQRYHYDMVQSGMELNMV